MVSLMWLPAVVKLGLSDFASRYCQSVVHWWRFYRQKVMAQAANSSLKEVTMELGGKSPLIICEDADLDLAADIAMMANFYSSGQVCTNGTRVFVPLALKAEFEEKILQRVEHIAWVILLILKPISVRFPALSIWKSAGLYRKGKIEGHAYYVAAAVLRMNILSKGLMFCQPYLPTAVMT